MRPASGCSSPARPRPDRTAALLGQLRAAGIAGPGYGSRLAQQHRDGQGREARARYAGQSLPTEPDLPGRRDGEAACVGGGELAERGAPVRTLSRQPRSTDVRHCARPMARRSTIGCCLRRGGPAGAIRSSFSFTAAPGQQGRTTGTRPCRSSNTWSTRDGSSSPSTIAAPTAGAKLRNRNLPRLGDAG